MGLALAARLAESVSAKNPDLKIEVLPSMGTSGGLRALTDGVIQIAIAARPLKPEERAIGLQERACLITPLLFATSRDSGGTIALANLPEIYSDPVRTWPDGMPLKVILRARSSSEMPFLARKIPTLKDAFESAFRRPGMAIGVTDQINADLAQSIEGSFAIMTLLQIRSESLDLRTVAIDGVEPTAKAALDGRYPLAIRFCFVTRPILSEGDAAFLDQVVSENGRGIARRFGAILDDRPGT